ncbi:MAG: flavohemoglobin expression-modulating QEGLA motif protein [Bacteroidetes bacterium]|jgi:uncharacterized protein (TIGR02421 family)|nr:flavohemoglobin expression-modulating QEGLA motif protein [Bacteroidota bacterium]
MLKLSIDDILKRINQHKTFQATTEDESFSIFIDDYVPYVCAAIHAGHNFREELHGNCLLNENERLYEEDPKTDQFISGFPIRLVGNDTRYEYDLNRNPADAIYGEAWGKQVWKKPLTKKQKETSLSKHHNFYKVVYALIKHLEETFNSCLVFDIHSFNYKRYNRILPVINIGTDLIDTRRYNKAIKKWFAELRKIEIPDIETTVAINDIFYGRGYLAEFAQQNFRNTLILPTEVKKVYGDEEQGVFYPVVVDAISVGMRQSIINLSKYFNRYIIKDRNVKAPYLLSQAPDKETMKVDRELFQLVRNFEILNFINPVNLEQEKKRFFQSKFNVNPEFRYRQLVINPFEFKRKLYNIKVEQISDINIQNMYKDVIDAYADKVDLIATIGTDKFVYNSLRYFGEPSENDVSNAQFIMHAGNHDVGDVEENISVEAARNYFRKEVADYGFDCKVEIAKNIVAKVLVLNNKKTIRLRRGTYYSERALRALSEHEIGVHMVTTINARNQPLQILRLGLPVNTLTQEGLAILSEMLSGNLSIERLKELALRVLCIQSLLRGKSFRDTFYYIRDLADISAEKAFYFTARVYRGGGFTKDFLYLRGFRDILNYYQENGKLDSLLVGKTSLKYVDTINEMIDRKLLNKPSYITKAFEKPNPADELISFVVKSIQ